MSNVTNLADHKRSTDIQEQIQTVFERQRANRWQVANTTAGQRIEKLKRLKAAILAHHKDLTDAMYADFRKNPAEVDLTELQPVLTEINHTISHLKKWMKPVAAKTPLPLFGTKSVVRYEPKGMVLVLAPWNYPFNLLINPLVAAIAAGNCVMLRPSDKVPNTSKMMKALLEEVFPENEVAIFTGPSSIANILLELPFDHIVFTGSTRIGKQVMASAANNLAAVTLELGGQSPVIVDETADINTAAQRIVWGKYINGGQTCVAPNHIFVHESKVNAFVEAAKGYIVKHYGATEEARQKSECFCRIVDVAGQKRLTDLIDRSVAAGAKLEIGGKGDATERYVAPTILSNVNWSMPVMEAEIFGPIMPVISYRDVSEVTTAIQSRGKPLAMYIFSGSQKNIDHLLNHTSAGGTCINNVIIHLANPDLPFGGIGDSGLGNYHGLFGFKTLSHERAVLVQKKPATATFFYPPYSDGVKKMVGFFTKFLS